ncbi:MAG: PorP/SprF family type IX secretion system membrane protein [Prevotellaceae bacterium]|jgi:type IX secretion system PorP/SprF family membrane protein|nr:PorP/SprF family type IX secretion system membrane protein [Prevotellaceae bacterium]
MNGLHKILLSTLLLLIVGRGYTQQSPQFNLGFANPTFVNPGYAGNNKENLFCASAYNRLELTGFDEAPVSTVINVQGPIDILGVHSGVSLTLQNEQAGFLRAPEVNLGYAYRRTIGSGQIGIGLSLGFIGSWYASNSWRLPSGGSAEGDPAMPTTQDNAGISFDMGAGVYYSDSRWFGGLSAMHLTRPALGIDNNAHYQPTLYAMGGYTFLIDSTTWQLRPMIHIVSDFAQGSFNTACNVVYENKYWAGISYRWGQAIAGMIGVEILPGLRVAYAYEYATSVLSRFSNGTHEMMLSYSFAISTVRGAQQYKSVRFL